ncbi:MAG: CCE_0567 family metalloprotein [Spirochaetia bacterium]|nr:CCE_0567 family metalloprotein [Spirochaetia bacterium]
MENSREIAKLKRQCVEVAGKIHDVVEENLWTDYSLLPELSRELVEKIQIYESANKTCQSG